MGLACTKSVLGSTTQSKGEASGTTNLPTDDAENKTDGEKSMAYFDAQEEPQQDILESIREKFRGTIYFDALSCPAEEDNEGKEDDLFRYAPASESNPHPRSSVAFDQSETLLKSYHDKTAASAVIMQELKKPRQKVDLEGYPGDLTPQELEACQDFRRRLKKKDPSYYGMVLGMAPVEEEAYAVCRFMRARNFQVDAVLEMMDGCMEPWKDAAKNGFYASIEEAVGHSASVFFTQWPSVFSGTTHSGTVAVYLRVGHMSVEGFESLMELDALSNFIWYAAKQKFTRQVTALQEANTQTPVRCEVTYVIDLKHLTMSQVTNAAMDAMKNMVATATCFPEVLNKAIVLNAPSFFSIVWRIVKVFLHPRTARKVEIFSNTNKGNQRLKELQDPRYVPSDYGGQAPSFDAISREQYFLKGCRQTHKLLSASKNKNAEWKFTLNDKEQASVTVYTRSSVGANFTISSGSKSVAHCFVENSGENGPYSREIASKLEAPGTFKVTTQSKSNQSDHFLVIVSVSM